MSLALSGLKLIGVTMKGLWFVGWLGGLILVLAWIGIAVATTFGGGAWLHTEFTTGTLGRWWQGRRGRNGGPPPAGAPSPAPPSPPPPPPPSPHSAFATPPPPSSAEVMESGSGPSPGVPAGGSDPGAPGVPPATPGA